MFCAICLDLFKNTDEVYATKCGHIYHLHCLLDWSKRSLTCPQCRTRYSVIYKMFCDFENAENEALKTVLLLQDEYIAKLQEQVASNESSLDESQRECAELQEELEYYRAKFESIDWDRVRKISEQIDQEKLRDVEGKNKRTTIVSARSKKQKKKKRIGPYH